MAANKLKYLITLAYNNHAGNSTIKTQLRLVYTTKYKVFIIKKQLPSATPLLKNIFMTIFIHIITYPQKYQGTTAKIKLNVHLNAFKIPK